MLLAPWLALGLAGAAAGVACTAREGPAPSAPERLPTVASPDEGAPVAADRTGETPGPEGGAPDLAPPSPREEAAAWIALPDRSELSCARFSVDEGREDDGVDGVMLEGMWAGVSIRLYGRRSGPGVVVDSYSLMAAFGDQHIGIAGQCARMVSPHDPDPPPADLRLFADRARCERAAGRGQLPDRCFDEALASFVDDLPGQAPPADDDPLLERMRRGARIWVVDGKQCLSWTLNAHPDDATSGSIERRWREPDGTRVEIGYDYEYGDRVLRLSGPGGKVETSDSSEVWGTGCTERLSVSHQTGASEVGGVLWHYSEPHCKRQLRRTEAGSERGATVTSDASKVPSLGGC
jgi:hypothetical protein